MNNSILRKFSQHRKIPNNLNAILIEITEMYLKYLQLLLQQQLPNDTVFLMDTINKANDKSKKSFNKKISDISKINPKIQQLSPWIPFESIST